MAIALIVNPRLNKSALISAGSTLGKAHPEHKFLFWPLQINNQFLVMVTVAVLNASYVTMRCGLM